MINTHRMLCSNQQVLLQAFPFMADEPPVLVDWLPWNHTFGGNHNYGIALDNGDPGHRDDGKLADLLRRRKRCSTRVKISTSVYFNVPKGFEELVQALEGDVQLRETFFRRLRLMFFAGAGLPKPVADRLHAIADKHTAASALGSTPGWG